MIQVFVSQFVMLSYCHVRVEESDADQDQAES